MPSAAQYVLDHLLTEGRIHTSDVSRAVASMQREITDLEDRLHLLRGAGRPGAAPARSAPTHTPATPQSAAAKPKGRAKPVVTAETRASWQLQGRYLGLLRQIPKSGRAKFKTIATGKGREAAIAAMQTVLRKRS